MFPEPGGESVGCGTYSSGGNANISHPDPTLQARDAASAFEAEAVEKVSHFDSF